MIEKVQKLGDRAMVPTTAIPKVGIFAALQDPQGAVISVMQYGYDPSMKLHKFSKIEKIYLQLCLIRLN